MLLPMTLPTAIYTEPIRAAESDTIISGEVVQMAKNNVPTKLVPRPVVSEI